jgi:hypothetical protein
MAMMLPMRKAGYRLNMGGTAPNRSDRSDRPIPRQPWTKQRPVPSIHCNFEFDSNIIDGSKPQREKQDLQSISTDEGI